jgi:radical SAM-linked protein
MRNRLIFSKLEPMRYTGHLDLFRTWERTIRRAGLPLAYSQGFNPRPRINLASALPLGFTSRGEVMDMWLEEDRRLDVIEAAIEDALPPGLFVSKLGEIATNEPSLQSQLTSADYKIKFLDPIDDFDARIEDILRTGSLPRERRGKPYDLRQLILSAQRLPDDNEGHCRLFLRLTAREGATGRPEEFILTLGVDPTSTQVERTQLIFQE